jgi:thioredoxin 1
MSDAYKIVTDENFQKDVLQSELPVVVDFWAPWCAPCRMMAPFFEELAHEYANKMVFAKLNTDENMQTMMQFGIQSIPTLLFFYKGKIVEPLVGARPRNDLKQHIERVLSQVATAS